jgi:ATP-dependent helicase/nuclease subunit B
VLGKQGEARRKAYTHQGLFNVDFLRKLDNRLDANCGDQFDYRLTKAGELYRNSKAGMAAANFASLLDAAAEQLVQLGRRIFAGEVQIDPYKRNRDVACHTCDYKPVCRIDPWTHHFRVLRRPDDEDQELDA